MNSFGFFCTIMAILCWAATSLLYKAGIHRNNEKHICLKYAVSVRFVFFMIALVYLLMRKEPFSIWKVPSDSGRSLCLESYTQ